MSLARCTVLLALVLIVMPGIAAAESAPSPAVIGKELIGVLPQGFTLVHADKAASVSVEGFHGYRIVLREEHEFPISDQQMAPIGVPTQRTMRTLKKVTHVDLVIFPDLSEATFTRPSNLALYTDAKRVTSGLKNSVEWQGLEQAYFVKPVYMGKGHGYYWFGRTTIYFQDSIRREMKLTGGDDRAALAIEGLEDDRDVMTRDSMHLIFRDLGDAAIPALVAAIKKHENNPLSYMQMLGEIETDRSTAALRSFYWSRSTDVSWAAGVVLAHSKTRMAAKPEYLDLLHRKDEVDSIAAKCVEHGWTEAIPDLEAVMAGPEYWTDFQAAYRAHRTLTGRPVDDTVHESWRGYEWSGREGEDARSALDRVEDKEAAAVILIGAYGLYSKITADQRPTHDRAVLDALHRLPIEIVRPLAETAARCTSKYERNRFTKLLSELKGMVDG